MMFGILIVSVFAMGIVSTADAHPHGNVELMESHSHDSLDEKFQESFIVHTFDNVIISIVDFFSNIFTK